MSLAVCTHGGRSVQSSGRMSELTREGERSGCVVHHHALRRAFGKRVSSVMSRWHLCDLRARPERKERTIFALRSGDLWIEPRSGYRSTSGASGHMLWAP